MTYRFRAQVMKIISKAKAKPSPIMIPYPKPCDKGAVKVVVSAMMSDLRETGEDRRTERCKLFMRTRGYPDL